MREFLNMSDKGSGVPLANTLCERYVQKIYAQKQQEIQAKLQQQKTAVIVDETSDVTDRYVVNILMQPLDEFTGQASCQALLASQQEFQEQVDNSTTAQVVIRSLANMNTGLKNVLAFVSDNAVYMKKCFNDGLEAILPNAVHVTCWAHIVFLAGAQFRSALQLTDNLVALVKEMFSKAPGRRARCLNHLRQLNAGQI